MREISICNNTYLKRHGEEECYLKMAEHGYTCCDYGKFVNTETPWFNVSDELFEKQCKEDFELAKKHGIKIYQVHAPWRWPSKDATCEDRQDWFERMVKSIHGTALLNCKNFVIHPLMPFCGDDPDPKFLWDVNLDFFSRLIPYAKQEGVTLCFENMPMKDLSISPVEACIKFLDLLNSEQMGICLDTGHAWVFGTEPADAVRLLGDRIKAFHVHDNKGDYDSHLLPFHGTIDWEAFRVAIRECVDESIPLSLEIGANDRLPGEISGNLEKFTSDIARYLAN